MNILKKAALLAGVSLAVLSLSAAPLAFAHNGEDDGDSNSTSSHPGDDDNDRNRHGSGSNDRGRDSNTTLLMADDSRGRSGNDDGPNHDANDDSKLRSRVQKLLDEKRGDRVARSLEARQKACEKHKDGIQKKLTKLGTRAQKHLDNFNTLFDKVKAYQEANNLSVGNYDELVATVVAKQTAAVSAIETFKAQTATIDCTSDDPANGVAVGKTTADDMRSALKEYRSSLKNLVNALLDAKEDQ